MNFARVEKWVLIESHRPGKSLAHMFLFGLSIFYRALVFLRNRLFDFKVLPVYKSKKKVVSIGNIVAGGTGKTAFTELLAKRVGLPVAILERGYRARKKREEPFLVRSPEEGDEAFLLSKKIGCSKVIVAKKRRKSAKMAEGMCIDYILLDDGMQHRYLHRDIEIVVVHYSDLFGGNAFLPRGMLRDHPKRLKQANYVVVNGVQSEFEFQDAKSKLEVYTKAPLIGVAYEVLEKERWKNRIVGAFCGIGRPEEFYALLHSLGCRIVASRTLQDHAYFDEVDSFVRDARKNGAEIVVCTEKDFVKLYDKNGVLPIKVELNVRFGERFFSKLVEEIWLGL